MHTDIRTYNNSQSGDTKEICNTLAKILEKDLTKAESKVWHGGPVWFIDGNPVVGYWVRKNGVQLLFWSGQSFDESGLTPEGSFKAAEKLYVVPSEIKITPLRAWLQKAKRIQWDYKNIVKRKGKLEKIGNW